MHLTEGILLLEQAIGWSAIGLVALAWTIRVLATRCPDLLPKSLRALKSTPKTITNTEINKLCVSLSGCNYKWIDKTIFGATAKSAARLPTDSIINLSQGEVGLAMSILILFRFGFIAGRCREQTVSGGRDALLR